MYGFLLQLHASALLHTYIHLREGSIGLGCIIKWDMGEEFNSIFSDKGLCTYILLFCKVILQLNLVELVLFKKLLRLVIIGLKFVVILFEALVSGFVYFLDFASLALKFGNHFIFPL